MQYIPQLPPYIMKVSFTAGVSPSIAVAYGALALLGIVGHFVSTHPLPMRATSTSALTSFTRQAPTIVGTVIPSVA